MLNVSRACECAFLAFHPRKSFVSSVSRSVSFQQKTPYCPVKEQHTHIHVLLLSGGGGTADKCGCAYPAKEMYITFQKRYILLLNRDIYYFSKEIYITSQKRFILLLKRGVHCLSEETYVASHRLCAAEKALRSIRVLCQDRYSRLVIQDHVAPENSPMLLLKI